MLSILNELAMVVCHKYSASVGKNGKQIPLQKGGKLLKPNTGSVTYHSPYSILSKSLINSRRKADLKNTEEGISTI